MLLIELITVAEPFFHSVIELSHVPSLFCYDISYHPMQF